MRTKKVTKEAPKIVMNLWGCWKGHRKKAKKGKKERNLPRGKKYEDEKGDKRSTENSDEFVGLPKRSPKKWPEKVKRKGNIKVTKKVTRKSPKTVMNVVNCKIHHWKSHQKRWRKRWITENLTGKVTKKGEGKGESPKISSKKSKKNLGSYMQRRHELQHNTNNSYFSKTISQFNHFQGRNSQAF